jgi:hypothetical protein
MEKPVFTVGDRTDKFCAVCHEERGHIVTSVSKRGQISRVSCSKCDTVSTFKLASRTLPHPALKTPSPYDRTLTYRAGQSMTHDWALRRVAAVEAAAIGDEQALRLLGFHGDRRTSSHAFLRLMWLADRPSDAARILGTWTWPRSLRASRDAIMPFWGRRMRRSFTGRFHYTRGYDGDSAGR